MVLAKAHIPVNSRYLRSQGAGLRTTVLDFRPISATLCHLGHTGLGGGWEQSSRMLLFPWGLNIKNSFLQMTLSVTFKSFENFTLSVQGSYFKPKDKEYMDTLHVILQCIFIISEEIRIGCPYALSTLCATHHESVSVNCYSYSTHFFRKTTVQMKESKNWSKNLSEHQASWWCSTCCSNSVSLKLSTFFYYLQAIHYFYGQSLFVITFEC